MEEQNQTPDLPLTTKASVFVGTAIPALTADMIGHWGVTGLALGGFAAFALAKQSPEIYAGMKGFGLWPHLPEREPGQRTIWDRLTGQYPSIEAPSALEQEVDADPLSDDLDDMEPLQPRSQPAQNVGDEMVAPAGAGPLYFSEILRTFTPTLNKIYLGTLPTGQHVFIQARDLCHTALAGATRGGKSELIRQLMSQLCYAGAKCYLINPHYTRYDLEARDPFGRQCPEDWTPFEAYLKNDPRELIPLDRKYIVIEHYLKQAYEMVGRRLEAYGYSEKPLGAPQFLFIDELPAIVDEVPDAAAYLKRILREGAKVGVFVVNASQDFQVTTLFKEIGGGVRKCYRTAFDVGSDPATQRALGLPLTAGLGKGNASLRCDDRLSSLRVPFVDNDALYVLLGPSTYSPSSSRAAREDDELLSSLISGQHAERYTESIPTVVARVPAGTANARRMQRLQRLRGVPVQAEQAPAEQNDSPEDRLAADERKVLEAYRNGAKTGMAIKSVTGIAGTRVNECLHKLGPVLGLIDWQPRQK